MTRYSTMVDDIPTVLDASLGGISYQESIPVTTDIGVSGTGYNAAHTVFTLPNSKTYDGTIDELVVDRNGKKWVEGVDYTYEASSTATTITATVAVPKNARINFTI